MIINNFLYKGMRIDNNNWIMGYFYINDSDKTSRIIESTTTMQYGRIVYNESVSQSIGKKDINDNNIFCNDIILFYLEPCVFENGSAVDYFGVEAENNWFFPSKATGALRCIATIYFDSELLQYSIRDIHVKVLDIDKDEDFLEYKKADPKELSGGADGYNYKYLSFYKTLEELESDHTMGYEQLGWNSFKYVEIIGNKYEADKYNIKY